MTLKSQCTICNIGLLKAQKVTYTRWLGHHLVTMPNTAVWVCDVCGDVMYEPGAVTRLEKLVGANGKPGNVVGSYDFASSDVERLLSQLVRSRSV